MGLTNVLCLFISAANREKFKDYVNTLAIVKLDEVWKPRLNHTEEKLNLR